MTPVSFGATASAVFTVFFVGVIGFFAARRRILTPAGNAELARVLVDFILPATLFNAMFSQYTRGSESRLGQAIIAQLCLFSVGSVSALILHRLIDRRSPAGTVAVLSSLQNNIYLPLPIALAVLPHEMRPKGEFIIGCFVVCFTPLLWSVGILMLGIRDSGQSILKTLMNAFNPPFLAAVLGLLTKILFLHESWTMPEVILNALKLTGSATTPLAMVVLGALLAEHKWTRRPDWRPLTVIVGVKLFLLPAVALFVLTHMPWLSFEFAFIVLLEASMPPATNISVAAKRFGLNTDLIAIAILTTYLIGALTIPMWISCLPPPGR